ncbi:MAG: cysteine--tRNA ligase [Candidatus Staskawiczbacteria bacterium RIFCSPLOWO2_01_FULL_38_12b]|uniref:Cysteine--tRNA ligase n=1 Tax=Candidatus Staskawiczbacteria bacterium RIFCSPLOWO2_01_FULL_38_12b TaxID=1802214 RepID=A0A1G2ICY4_9BACT|nr:MAG: cysteine--tRNA ligase [Candidatus Staskawiczbacteria bacterium RIFCSPLOWO2_01_FULL_38_12b]
MVIYNTLSKKKDVIKPIKGKKINLFVCGPTVYDFSHIGHARTYVFFDAFVRYLRGRGFTVFYLQNITDIDDRIIQRAREKGVPIKDLADAFTKEYLKNMKALGITSVNKYAKATDYIKEIISQIQRLQKKRYAYSLDDGIYFDILKFKNYGKLSGRTVLESEDSVSRIDYSKNKRNRGDFCLWKFKVEGEPFWPAPFGAGRPGWHTEDTAITETFFGAQYDIHGGGRDLIFPHHEAEITQMEAISGKKPMARYWMHTGFLTMDEQKMSKSLGNFIVIDDFLKRYSPQQLRFWITKNLWHSPIDYSESVMIEVKMSLEKIEEFLRKLKVIKSKVRGVTDGKLLKTAKDDFYTALADDFNTPKAFAVIFEFIKEINKLLDQNLVGKKAAKDISAFFVEINTMFDIIDFKKLKTSNVPHEVSELVKTREQYRKVQNWEKSDEIRHEIEKYGFSVDDTKDGTVLKKM